MIRSDIRQKNGAQKRSLVCGYVGVHPYMFVSLHQCTVVGQNKRIKGWCLIRCLFVCVRFIVISIAEVTQTCSDMGKCVCFIVMNMAEGMALSLLIKGVEG